MGCGGRDGGGCLYTVIQWKTNSHGILLLVPTLFSPVYILYIQTGSPFNLSVWARSGLPQLYSCLFSHLLDPLLVIVINFLSVKYQFQPFFINFRYYQHFITDDITTVHALAKHCKLCKVMLASSL